MSMLRDAVHDEELAVRNAAHRGLLQATERSDCLASLVSSFSAQQVTPALLCRGGPAEEQQQQKVAAPPATSTRTSTRGALPAMDVPPTPAPSAAAPAMSSRASPEAPPPWRMSLGYMLVLRVLAHPEGVGALSHSGWLDEELTDWVSGPTASTSAAAPRKGGEAGTKCEAYLLGVEARLLEALQQADPDYPSAAFAHAASNANGGVTQTTDTALSHRPSLPLPPHLLGALAATAAGRTALGQRRALRWALTAIEEAAASTPPLASHLLPPPPPAAALAPSLGSTPSLGSMRSASSRLSEVDEHSSFRSEVDEPPSPSAQHARESVGSASASGRSSFDGSSGGLGRVGSGAPSAEMGMERRAVVERAALWAVAHAGSSAAGFDWLVDHICPQLIVLICRIAAGSECFSLRGAAIFSLGILASSGERARAALAQSGWRTPQVPGGYTALPDDEHASFLRPPTRRRWGSARDVGAEGEAEGEGAGSKEAGEARKPLANGGEVGNGGGQSDLEFLTRRQPTPREAADVGSSGHDVAADDGDAAAVGAALLHIGDLANSVLRAGAQSKVPDARMPAQHAAADLGSTRRAPCLRTRTRTRLDWTDLCGLVAGVVCLAGGRAPPEDT